MKRFTLSALACAAILTSASLMADPTPAAAPSTTPATPSAPAPATPPATTPDKPGHPGGDRHAKMKEVMESLNLTDAQKAQIAKIREDKTLDPKARHEAVAGVLTPEQKAKFDAAMPKHKNK